MIVGRDNLAVHPAVHPEAFARPSNSQDPWMKIV